MTTRAALRPLLSGLLVIVLLAGAGVGAAALLRPDPDSSPMAERAAATSLPGEEAVSLDGLERPRSRTDDEPAPSGPPPKTAEVIGVGTGEFSAPAAAAGTADVEDVDGPADPGDGELASDVEIRGQLAEFRDHLGDIDPRKGARAYVGKDGRAVLPEGAPREVALVVAAANEIATKPTSGAAGTARGRTPATTARARCRSRSRAHGCSTRRSPPGRSCAMARAGRDAGSPSTRGPATCS